MKKIIEKKYMEGQQVMTYFGQGYIKKIKKVKKGFCYFVVTKKIGGWFKPLYAI